MSFFGDNIFGNLLNNSTKTHEDLDRFINKKFSYYLNNSNLLLNFVSDFEDYKNNERNDNKSKCDECESLYILTSQIFEKYINKMKVPFDINIYSEGKENSGINYNNKVLYFFDLKDLNKILQSNNLAKRSENDNVLIKKRILCKIISLSFIKIYIIIKSIFQTFNIYSSLIKNKNTIEDTETRNNIGAMPEFGRDTLPDSMSDSNPYSMPDSNPYSNPDLNPGLNLDPNPDPNPDPGLGPKPDAEQQEKRPQEVPPISGGGIFDFLNPFPNKATDQKNDITDEPQRMIRLQTSNNVFYSLFVILFANTESELTAKNFTASYLSTNLNTISNELFNSKLPTILKYICDKKLFESNFISKNSIVFNDNNFKFLKLKTSDTLENDATYYLREIDEKYTLDDTITSKETKQYFSQKNLEFIKNYSIIKNFDLTILSILSSVKGILQTMITNYFKTRNTLYDSIIKKLIKFNPRTNEIENINPNLTYENIVKLTNQTKTILLNLHSNVFESLNNIITKIRESILRKYGDQFNDTNKIEANSYKPEQPILQGGKTRKKYYKKYNRKYSIKHYKKTKKYKY